MAAASPTGRPGESRRPLLLGGIAIALLLLLWALRNIVVLVAFSMLLAYALDPLVSGIGRLRLPRGRTIPRGAASGLVILGLLAVAGWLLAFGLPRLTAELSGFLQRLPGNLQSLAGAARAWAAAQGLGAYVDPVVDGLRAQASSFAPQAGSLLLGWLGRALGGLIQIFALAVLPVLTFYLLAEREAVRSSLLRFMPEEWHARIGGAGEAVDRALKSYVRGQALVCLTIGTATGLTLAALGFPNAFLLGALVGAAEVIPYLGFAIAAVAIVLAGFGVSPLHAALGIAVYALINSLIGILVTPRVMGRHLKMHPFVVTVSVLAGAELLGPAGVVLALPGAAVIQSLIEEFVSKPAPSGVADRRGIPRLVLAFALAVVEPTTAVAAISPQADDVPTVREKRYVLSYTLDYGEEQLRATARLTISNSGRRSVRDVPLLLYRLLTVHEVRSSRGAALPFTQRVVAFSDEPRRQVNAITVKLDQLLAPGGSAELVLTYSGFLAGYVETGERYVKDRIDPGFTILRLDALAYPVVGYPSDRSRRLQGMASFDYEAAITAPETLQVANGGRLIERRVADGRATWVYRNLEPCWRMDFAIAKYRVLGGDTTTVFCFPEDSANARRVQAAALASMRLFADWFGSPGGPSRFSVIEVPDGWGSQKDVTCILQSAAAFRDPQQMYEVYHEVSHMWNVESRDSFPPRIEEGLATYLEDVATERLEGGDPVRRSHARIVTWLRELLEKRPAYHDLAVKDYGIRGETDLSYWVGSLMFEILHALVGDRAFAEIIGGFRRRFAESGATTAQFIAFAQERSPVELSALFRDWYETTRWQRLVREERTLEQMVAEYRTTENKR